MDQTQLEDACGTLQNLGCVFIGTTKTFSGRMTKTVGENVLGIDLSGHRLSLVVTLNQRVVIESSVEYENKPGIPGEPVPGTLAFSNGYWELKVHTNETKKLQPDTEYIVEFALFDLRSLPVEMEILGRGVLLANKALHHG